MSKYNQNTSSFTIATFKIQVEKFSTKVSDRKSKIVLTYPFQ